MLSRWRGSRQLRLFVAFPRGNLGSASTPRASSLARVKILFIGDIVGRPGRRAVQTLTPQLRIQHGLDVVIANGENSAGGAGISPSTAKEIFEAGVDVITTGDHLWDQKDVVELLKNESNFLRPINYRPDTLGQGWTLCQKQGLPPVGVINAQGRTFMAALENPFAMVRDAVEEIRKTTPIIFLDFHAEATSEKIAMGRMLDGKVSAVVGTHTHVQTADEQIFPGGTAFLCDAGFTGPHDSVLGRDVEPVIERFLTYEPRRFPVAKDRVLLQGVIVEVDESTGKATEIERVSDPMPPMIA